MGTLILDNIGKAYRHYPHPLSRIVEWFGGADRHTENWVLRHIDLKVEPGESLGIVGRNGAGKSTLLKLITGVSFASEGSVHLSGRVSALLELGMGFHPEFTGRQNVYMQAYLHGLSHDEVTGLMPGIAAFAEIGDYFDQPVRIYSSGMQVRLAFSVATALRPDILIVDEALAVGDAYFQHKCYDRIRKYRAEGTTLLFVSHDPSAIKSLCDRAVLIDGGRIIRDGPPADVLDIYNALIAPDADASDLPASGEGFRSGNGAVRITQLDMLSGSKSLRTLTSGQAVTLKLQLEARRSVDDLTVGLLIKDRLGNDVFGSNTHHFMRSLAPIAAGESKEIEFYFPRLALGPGHYSLTLAAHASSNHLAGSYDWWERALVFHVTPGPGPHTIGVCHMPLECTVNNVTASP